MPEERKRILDLSERIFEVLGPDKQLAVEFFVVFSRFEFALKRNQYLKKGEKRLLLIGMNLQENACVLISYQIQKLRIR